MTFTDRQLELIADAVETASNVQIDHYLTAFVVDAGLLF